MISIFSDANSIVNIVILLFLVGVSVAVVFTLNLIVACVLLSIFSILMVMEYIILCAPDVAITEAAVGTGISTVLLLFGIFLVGDKEKRMKGGKLLPFVMICAVATIIIYASRGLPVFGSATSAAQQGVAAYYIKTSIADTGLPNIVTAILASYRAYDTFGEILIIFTAGVAVLMLLGRFSKSKK